MGREEVYQFLKQKSPRWLTAVMISEALNSPSQRVRESCNKLVKSGDIWCRTSSVRVQNRIMRVRYYRYNEVKDGL